MFLCVRETHRHTHMHTHEQVCVNNVFFKFMMQITIYIFFKKNHLKNGLKTCRLYILYRYCTSQPPLLHIMPYSPKPDNDVICQCGCIVKKYYMPKHLQTIRHERNMVGRENIQVAEHHRYKITTS